MSFLDPPDHDLRGARHRARREELAAPDAYPRDFGLDADGLEFDRGRSIEPESAGEWSRPNGLDPLPEWDGPDPLAGPTRPVPVVPTPTPAGSDVFGTGASGSDAPATDAARKDTAPKGVSGTDAAPDGSAPSKGRAGRNLPAAIAVGLILGGVVLASLLVWRPAFVFVIAAAAGIGTWEMVRAVAHDNGPRAPLVPLLSGCAVMVTLAWFGGAEALTLGLVLTVLAAMIWRLADGPVGYQPDVLATVLIAVYVPFLGSFAALLVKPEHGTLRVIVTLAAVVLSDTGGYVAGVFFGRRPMAPTVSPKKSWEGFAGSLVITGTGGALLLFFLFHVPWWHGAIFGLALAGASVLGDLAESLLKRDLGIKDMSHLLPGHGGLMDRLDSILFALPAGFILLSLLTPVTG